jgi:hypothetical protein
MNVKEERTEKKKQCGERQKKNVKKALNERRNNAERLKESLPKRKTEFPG